MCSIWKHTVVRFCVVVYYPKLLIAILAYSVLHFFRGCPYIHRECRNLKILDSNSNDSMVILLFSTLTYFGQ